MKIASKISIRRWAVTTALSAAGLIGASGALQAQSLQHALVHVMEDNPSIQAAQLQSLQAIETYNQAVAATKLQVNASISAERRGDFDSATDPSDTTTAALQFSQNLFQGSFDGIPAGIWQALGGISNSNAGYRSQEAGILSQAVSAYMSVLRDEASVGVAVSSVNAAEQEVEAAEARQRAGEGTRTEVALANANLAQARASLVSSRATYDSARSTYAQLVGEQPGTLFDPGFPVLPGSLQQAINLGLERHPSLDSAKIAVELAETAVITTRAQYGLAIQATGSLSATRQENGFGTTDTEGYSIGIQGSIPLIDGGTRRAAIASAERDVEIARASYLDQQAAVRAQIEAAWANSAAQIARLNSLIAFASAQEVVLRATEAEFDAGTATFLQVLNAQQDYAEAQDSYVRAKADAVVAAYNLVSATGGMTSEALGLPVEHFSVFDAFEDLRNPTYGDLLGLNR